jgi:hypothetical protein
MSEYFTNNACHCERSEAIAPVERRLSGVIASLRSQ